MGAKVHPRKMHPRQIEMHPRRGTSSILPDKKLRFDYDSWPRFATLCQALPFGPIFCKMTEASAAWQTGANWCKLEQFDAVLEVRNADKSIIHLPRQDLMPK